MSGNAGRAPEIVFIGAFRPLWWLTAALLLLAAWWGWPLLSGASLAHSFYGVSWYSMIGLAAAIWAVPAEQGCDGTQLERRWTLLGLLTLKRERHALADFRQIRLEQEPNRLGKDSVWVLFEGENGRRFAFAHYRASHQGIAQAQALARQLSTLSQLPFAEQPPEAG
ncbi:hypothetical protein SAMN02745857_01095 [Andreprevotia lacus DSM 23236]|uniref:Uncharacterized protein n=1 Tax=Andreprevotia lacus DSM 23236 TaxID=1121001 RepID=A0A1W1XAD7_9NEIS|nr:hypothetical protein [Andreprevotia lacus]SMC20985.1 hypothetical protein SAMN02745857_01095 [Andreprevotia lacus DSM 23236]